MALPFSTSLDLLTGQTPESSSGVTTAVTHTGVAYDVSKRQQIIVQFVSLNNAGSGAFTIDVSNDGTNWVTGVAFRDLTSATPATYATSKTLNSASTAAVKVTPGFRYIRAVCVVTTGGQYWAFLQAAG